MDDDLEGGTGPEAIRTAAGGMSSRLKSKWRSWRPQKSTVFRQRRPLDLNNRRFVAVVGLVLHQFQVPFGGFRSRTVVRGEKCT